MASPTPFEGTFYMPQIFPPEGRHAENFFRNEKFDGFGRVRTRELGYPQTTEAVLYLS
jgi:hypothetical protein